MRFAGTGAGTFFLGGGEFLKLETMASVQPWLAVRSREPWLGGDGASRRRTAEHGRPKVRLECEPDKWHQLRGGLPR
jgi:hypothetical protein